MTEAEKEKEIRDFIKKMGGDLKTLNLVQKVSSEESDSIEQQTIDDYIEEVRDLAEKKGLNFGAIFKVIVKKPRIILPPVYRDPENPKNTWTGVGAPKKWVKEWVIANKEDLTPLLIDKTQEKEDKVYLDKKQLKSIGDYKEKVEGKDEEEDEKTEKKDKK